MTREELTERLRALLAEGQTVSSAAVVIGIARCTAHKAAKAANLHSSPEAMKTAAERRKQTLAANGPARMARRDAVVLALLEERRGPGVSAQKLQFELGVSDPKALQIWDRAHPGERYYIPPEPKPKQPNPKAPKAVAPAPQVDQDKPGVVWREMMASARDRRIAIFQHTMRMRELPPVRDGEAATLVARFIAERGVTVCPPRVTAPINSGRGF